MFFESSNTGDRRYLWTDAFGVLGFVSLAEAKGRVNDTWGSSASLGAAATLIEAVHATLGTPAGPGKAHETPSSSLFSMCQPPPGFWLPYCHRVALILESTQPLPAPHPQPPPPPLELPMKAAPGGGFMGLRIGKTHAARRVCYMY